MGNIEEQLGKVNLSRFNILEIKENTTKESETHVEAKEDEIQTNNKGKRVKSLSLKLRKNMQMYKSLLFIWNVQ